ncbi:MAG: hypothetical protein RR504_00025 [Christensenellaceae bacterium]
MKNQERYTFIQKSKQEYGATVSKMSDVKEAASLFAVGRSYP